MIQTKINKPENSRTQIHLIKKETKARVYCAQRSRTAKKKLHSGKMLCLLIKLSLLFISLMEMGSTNIIF